MLLLKKVFYNKKIAKYQFMPVLFLLCFFFACNRSSSQSKRNFDPKLVQALNKLGQKYANKKVRINTWNKSADAYQDIEILDKAKSPTKQTLTIGDSVLFVAIDLNNNNQIQAEIKFKNNTGYIPYWCVEEFEAAVPLDPEL